MPSLEAKRQFDSVCEMLLERGGIPFRTKASFIQITTETHTQTYSVSETRILTVYVMNIPDNLVAINDK